MDCWKHNLREELEDQSDIYQRLRLYRQHIQALTPQFERLRDQLQESYSQNERDRVKLAQAQKLKQLFQNVVLQKEVLQTKFKRELTKMQQLHQQQLEGLQLEKQSALEELTAKLAQISSQNSNLKVQLKSCLNQAKGLAKRLRQEEQQGQNKRLLLKEKFEGLKQQILNLRQNNIELSDLAGSLRSKCKEYETDLSLLSQQNARITRRLSDKQKECQQLRQKEKECERQSQQIFFELKSKLSDKCNSIQSICTALERVQIQLSSALAGNKSLKQKLDRCKNKCDQLESGLSCHLTQIKRLHLVIERQQQEKQGLRELLTQLREQNSKLAKRNEDLQSCMQKTRARLQGVEWERRGIRAMSRREIEEISEVFGKLTLPAKPQQIWE